eukprot:TRINITY_DN14102_c0_g1_i3.p1 TRINITY_DN14102_c0_g1~~TRINITY_DN14102_c0_g1_i3.p1  ORF type:complete len:174 (+),score=30.16 TRINITY_DN14102_c0_g1_i3:70-591(+)
MCIRDRSTSVYRPSFLCKKYATLNCSERKRSSVPRRTYKRHELEDLSFNKGRKGRFCDVIEKLNNDSRYAAKKHAELAENALQSSVLNKSFQPHVITSSSTKKIKNTLAQLYNLNKWVFHKRKGLVEEKHFLENSEQRADAGRYKEVMRLHPKIFHKVNGEFTLYANTFAKSK